MERTKAVPYKIKRRNYMIDKKYQANFILKFCLLVIATGLFIMVALYSLAGKATTVSFLNSRVVVQSTADFLFPVLVQTFVIAAIVSGVATVLFTLIVSHRIAGPAYRIKKTLSSLGSGDFSSVCRVRQKDSLQDVAAALNIMMAEVRKNLAIINDNLTILKDKLEDAQKTKSLDASELKELKKEASEIDKALHYFNF